MTQEEKIRCIEEALAQVRPFLEKDGGDISFKELTPEGVLRISLHGSCRECHLKETTMALGLEEALRRMAPFVKRVEEV
ncbi:MAG: NifU family protein [Flavobacteriales bacterium]|nr:NifU family protein [Flavobacteriales bacterium]MCX7767586.1 NifU family protein [Flavobacteriales bacterium]MDW8410243.1 NifU family protein [Flavobacteriales bacterium]